MMCYQTKLISQVLDEGEAQTHSLPPLTLQLIVSLRSGPYLQDERGLGA